MYQKTKKYSKTHRKTCQKDTRCFKRQESKDAHLGQSDSQRNKMDYKALNKESMSDFVF